MLFERLQSDLDNWHADKSYRPLTCIDSEQSARIKVGGKSVIQLSSNNYLGLTTHPELKQAAIDAVDSWGVGTGSVRTIAGNFALHEQYEKRLAEFKKTESALVFQSGFTANVGVVASVLTENDVVISDELNHASIIDGIRLTKAKRRIYRHADMADLESALKEYKDAQVRFVVTDGVFSMDGDIAPLPEIVDLADKYDAVVMVDDAHASGVLGQNGRGSVDHFKLHGRVPIQIGTLSKAIGVLGGYVAGPNVLIDYLTQRARPLLFSTSHPPAVVAACDAALDVLMNEPELIDKLWRNTDFFRNGLQQLGFDMGASQTPIIPIMLGEDQLAQRFSALLLENRVCAQSIVFPTVARNKARVRTIVTAMHSLEDLSYCLDVFKRVGQRLGLI